MVTLSSTWTCWTCDAGGKDLDPADAERAMNRHVKVAGHPCMMVSKPSTP